MYHAVLSFLLAVGHYGGAQHSLGHLLRHVFDESYFLKTRVLQCTWFSQVTLSSLELKIWVFLPVNTPIVTQVLRDICS